MSWGPQLLGPTLRLGRDPAGDPARDTGLGRPQRHRDAVLRAVEVPQDAVGEVVHFDIGPQAGISTRGAPGEAGRRTELTAHEPTTGGSKTAAQTAHDGPRVRARASSQASVGRR